MNLLSLTQKTTKGMRGSNTNRHFGRFPNVFNQGGNVTERMRKIIAGSVSAVFLLSCSVMGCGGGAGLVGNGGSGNSGGGSAGGGLEGIPSGGMSIVSIAPNSAPAGSSDVTITISGSSFDVKCGRATNANVVWSASGQSDTGLVTTAESANEITAIVPASLMSKPGVAEISIQKFFKADDTPSCASNLVPFTVTSASTPHIQPAAVTLGPHSSQKFVVTKGGQPVEATWAIEEGSSAGSITSDGVYTPAAGSVGTFHVVGTLVNSQAEATASVSVVPAGFTSAGEMTEPRDGHTATLLADGRVLVAGGELSDASAEIFDPETGKFSATGSFGSERAFSTATLLLDGRVLFAGGLSPETDLTGHLTILNTTEIFDPATGLFSSSAKMQSPRESHTAARLLDGRVLITGGIDSPGGGGAAVSAAEIFDPVTGTFAQTGGMHTERADHTATLLPNGDVLVAGGWNGHRVDASDDPPWDPLFTELYSPDGHVFNTGADMSTTRIHHLAVDLGNSGVLMLGGIPSLQNIHAQPPHPQYAELYVLNSKSFLGFHELRLARQSYTATLLPDGKVLLVGGSDEAGPSNSVDLLDVSDGSLTPSGALSTARVGHTATLLKDGRVLVTGGTDANGKTLASAEIYVPR